MEAWEKKVERIENNPRRRAKESKVREYYEKQFPEIRKQRELQERMQRLVEAGSEGRAPGWWEDVEALGLRRWAVRGQWDGAPCAKRATFGPQVRPASSALSPSSICPQPLHVEMGSPKQNTDIPAPY